MYSSPCSLLQNYYFSGEHVLTLHYLTTAHSTHSAIIDLLSKSIIAEPTAQTEGSFIYPCNNVYYCSPGSWSADVRPSAPKGKECDQRNAVSSFPCIVCTATVRRDSRRITTLISHDKNYRYINPKNYKNINLLYSSLSSPYRKTPSRMPYRIYTYIFPTGRIPGYIDYQLQQF